MGTFQAFKFVRRKASISVLIYMPFSQQNTSKKKSVTSYTHSYCITDCIFEAGNGLGIRVVGGKEVPGCNGDIGAYVAKVLPGGAAEQTGKILEGERFSQTNASFLCQNIVVES